MFTQKLNRQPPGLSSQASTLHSNSFSTHFRTRNSFSPASIDLCGLGLGSTAEGLERFLCRMGQEAVWNWMLFLHSHHYPQTLTKDPNLPVPLNLGLKWKTYPMKGLFLFFFLLKGERERHGREIEGERGSLEPHFRSCSPFFLFFRPWATYWPRRQISPKIPWDFLFPSNQAAPSSPIFGIEVEGKKVRGEKSKGETLLKERTRMRGPPEAAVGEVS